MVDWKKVIKTKEKEKPKCRLLEGINMAEMNRNRDKNHLPRLKPKSKAFTFIHIKASPTLRTQKHVMP